MTGTSAITTPEQLRELMGTPFTFSPQQFAVITAPLEPAVVIAGAGAGKTTVMAARVVWLVASGLVRPDEVLGLTFTTKATHELAVGIRTALRSAGFGPDTFGSETTFEPADDDAGEVLEPTIATYNAYAASLLSEHGLRIGHEPDTRVVADASRYQLAARVIARYDGDVALLSDHPKTVINYLLSLDSAMSEHLVGVDEVRAFQHAERPRFEDALAGEGLKTRRDDVAAVINTIDRRDELLGLVEAYRAMKANLGLMDFGDQIERAARLARERPEVGAAERDKFKVVLLDEYQDTSVAQAVMLSRLFSGPTVDRGLGHPVTAVGDPNQAIYGWRGASVSNILDFSLSFPGQGGLRREPYPLTVNRRSDVRILDVANDLAAPLYAETKAVVRLEARAEADSGDVQVAVFDTYDDELAWLPAEVRDAYETVCGRRWSEIGVLTRDNAHAADVFDALSEAEIPVEIVGLRGLIRLPEVAEVVATLTLLHDLTANAEMLVLLTGPRWAIGERDLALLGRRSRAIVPREGVRARDHELSIADELATAVEGADPTEVPALWDALADPGMDDYSPEARERFQLLVDELTTLRRFAGEPLLDLVRRIIDVTGIDVELASSISPAAAARRDNLDLFVKAVAEFQAIDGDVTLPALLAYLESEDEFGTGLDVATPSNADSVKLLTVHRAKGLEWDAVFLVGVADEKFPVNRSRTKWTSGPGVLPSPLRGDRDDQPQLRGHDRDALTAFGEEAKQHQAIEELRLGYVAMTRPRHRLVVSSYCWTATRKTPLGPSPYQIVVRNAMAGWGAVPQHWTDKPPKGAANPLHAEDDIRIWPMEPHQAEINRRRAAAEAVGRALEQGPMFDHPDLDDSERRLVARWDDELDRLLAESRRSQSDVVDVPLPSSLSATAVARLRDDPDDFARVLARPMPSRPSPAARFGTRFHAWVEARFGQQQIVDPDDLPGRADEGIDSESELAELTKAFEAGPFGDRQPYQVEAPFALVLSGQVVRGRIDAIYRTDDGFQVVDWKTNKGETADPLQLALYRLAWSELTRTPLEHVTAAFYYVRTGTLVEHDDLAGRDELERMIRQP